MKHILYQMYQIDLLFYKCITPTYLFKKFIFTFPFLKLFALNTAIAYCVIYTHSLSTCQILALFIF